MISTSVQAVRAVTGVATGFWYMGTCAAVRATGSVAAGVFSPTKYVQFHTPVKKTLSLPKFLLDSLSINIFLPPISFQEHP